MGDTEYTRIFTCSSYTSSTGIEPRTLPVRPATNRLSHGTAWNSFCFETVAVVSALTLPCSR